MLESKGSKQSFIRDDLFTSVPSGSFFERKKKRPGSQYFAKCLNRYFVQSKLIISEHLFIIALGEPGSFALMAQYFCKIPDPGSGSKNLSLNWDHF